MAFNVLEYARELRETGFSQDQAEVQAKGPQLLQGDLLERVATKDDLDYKIELVKKEIKALDVKIEMIRSDLKKDIADLNTNLTKYIGDKTDKISGKIMTFMGLGIGFLSLLMVILRFWPPSTP